MKRVLILILLTVLVLGGAARVIRDSSQDGGPVFTPSQVVAGLARNPQQWVGRTVKVRGVVGAFMCPSPCLNNTDLSWASIQRGLIVPMLEDPGATLYTGQQNPAFLELAAEPRSPLLDSLSRLPVIGHLIPRQEARLDGPTVYRLRLHVRSCRGTCIVGVLTDAG